MSSHIRVVDTFIGLADNIAEIMLIHELSSVEVNNDVHCMEIVQIDITTIDPDTWIN